MSLHQRLLKLQAENTPIRIGIIGAGKFASMFLTQVRRTPGMHVATAIDIDVERVHQAFARTGWSDGEHAASSLEDAFRTGTTFVTDDAAAVIGSGRLDVVLEVTGNPSVGVKHALLAIENRTHIVMVNVEADSLVGPVLARRAAEAGVVYSMAYGDQPALICDLVDWCRTIGFDVVSAGKGTKYLPEYHASTPETVWGYYGFSDEQVASGDYNPKMFNSFIDGTKSAIEMVAVSNGTGLRPQERGLNFAPVGADDLQNVLRPQADGGILEFPGTVDVVSSLNTDGTDVYRDLRWGVFVTFEAKTEYAQRSLVEYGVPTDSTGRYAALYRPYHMIGLELGQSVSSVAIAQEPTGTSRYFQADVAAVAKSDLTAGTRLDGEGGYTAYGVITSAETSVREGVVPMGMAHTVRLTRDVRAGQRITWADVEAPPQDQVWELRQELIQLFEQHGPQLGATSPTPMSV